MIILSEDDKTFILENIKDAEDVINSDDIDIVLEKISEVMMYKGFEADNEINDFGRKAERVYDNIFYNND